MHGDGQTFGRELRKLRLAAGVTLSVLARTVHYSKGHLSKVERGAKAPNRELAQLCDGALRTGGVLLAMLSTADSSPSLMREVDGGDSIEEEVWIMQFSPAGESWFQPIGRRQIVAAGMASAMAVGLGSPSTAATGSDLADSSTVAVFQTLFENYRRLGQSVGPGVVLPALIAHTNTLRELSVHAAPRVRRELLRLGSRYAEYVGWLMQERGDDSAALWWTQRAVELAAAGGDRQLAAYAKVRHALVTLYRDEGDETVALARQARDGALPPRIRGLAVQREAQGHAINGDYDACMWCLDQARELLAAAVPDEGVPVIGSTNLSDSVGMITGWCLLDLGRPARAADVLDAQMRQVPAEAARTRARYGTRQARAHATAGDIEHACELARWVLPDVLAVSSATIAADLRELLRTLKRHPQNASVQELAPILTAALTVVTP